MIANHAATLSLLLVFGIASVAGLVGCGITPKTSDRDLNIIDHEKLEDFLADEDDPIVLIDVRSPRRYAEGHIPGAINIPMQHLRSRDPRLGEAARLVVYAGGWDDILSPAAAKKLIVLGYSGVFDYRGGMELWKSIEGDMKVETTP